MQFELRYYQKEAVEKMHQFDQTIGSKNALIVMATGTGKTEVFLTYIAEKIKTNPTLKVLILERSVDLISQIAKRILRRYPALTYQEIVDGVFPASQRALMPNISIGTSQSIIKYVTQELVANDIFDIIIIDESHHENGDSEELWNVCNYFNYSYCYGFTATPKTGHLFSCDNIIYNYSILQAQKDGYLISSKQIHYYQISVIDNPEQEKIANFEAAIEKICIQDKSRHCLWYCANIIAARMLETIMLLKGIDCGVLIGDTPKDQRNSYIDQLKKNPNFNLINVNVFNEGMDVPEIETIIIAKKITSDHSIRQIIGRGLRKCEGKNALNIYDLCVGQNIYNNFYSDIKLSNLEVLLNSTRFQNRYAYPRTKVDTILKILRDVPEEMVCMLQSTLRLFDFSETFIIPELSEFKFVYEGNYAYLEGLWQSFDRDSRDKFLFAVEQSENKYICYQDGRKFICKNAEDIAKHLHQLTQAENRRVNFITHRNARGNLEGTRTEPTEQQIWRLCQETGLDHTDPQIQKLIKTLYTKYSIGLEISALCAPQLCKPMVERIKKHR
jgi:superfamily II DNA or RNA helicase